MHRNSTDAHQNNRILVETRGSPEACVLTLNRTDGPVALEARARW